MEIRFHFWQMIASTLVVLFLLDFTGLRCNGVLGAEIDDGGTMFMEEVGENEIIPIETDHAPEKPDFNSLHESKRPVRDTAKQTSSQKLNSETKWRSEEDDGSGDGDEEEGEEYYDLDQNLEGAIEEENDENEMRPTPIMPTRVIPTLLSPSFGDGANEIEGTKTQFSPKSVFQIRPTKPLVLNNNIPNSIAHYDVSIIRIRCLYFSNY